MNSLDLNIDHRCSNWLPAHFIFILTGFSPWVNVYDMMIISCFDLSKTQSILFSLLWCSFDVGVYPSDLTIEAESCCIFSDFFGRYVEQDNRCRFVRRPSLSSISWLNDLLEPLELIFRLDIVFAIIYVVFPHNDMMTSIYMWKWWNHSTYSFSTHFSSFSLVTVDVGFYSLIVTQPHA